MDISINHFVTIREVKILLLTKLYIKIYIH